MLLKHLSLCHPRFVFTYLPEIHEKPQIDMVLNPKIETEREDLSQGKKMKGSKRKTLKPKKKSSYTLLLDVEPNREPLKLREFMEIRLRQFHRVDSGQHIMWKELRREMDDFKSPQWARDTETRRIDKNPRLNDQMRQMMKLWNEHIEQRELVGFVTN